MVSSVIGTPTVDGALIPTVPAPYGSSEGRGRRGRNGHAASYFSSSPGRDAAIDPGAMADFGRLRRRAAEGERRAREVLAHHRVALTILARGRSGALALNPDQNCGKWIVVTGLPQDIGRPERFAHAADGSLSIPLDEQAALTGVKSALQAQPGVPDGDPREPEILSFEGFTIDLADRSLHDCGGSEVPLTRSEFALLVALARHPGRVLSRDQPLDAALGRRAEPYDRCIDVLIGRFRRKIEPDPRAPRFILTVVGEGYKFISKLRVDRPQVQAPTRAPAGEEEPRANPPSPERRQLTVVSCGLAGSAALASRLDPEELRAVIADYHHCCTEVIGGFGGVVATAAGDRVVGYFGYPEAHEHDAERAVRAGLALIDAVGSLNIPLAPAHVRVGIASGLVVAGSAALDETVHQPVAVGEAPRLAAQFEAAAPPDAVVISRAPAISCASLFDYREAGRVALEGVVEPIPAWQIVGTSAAASRFEALRSGGLTRLIGRDEELDLLLRRWRQIQSGEGRVVLISGEPGIGKSRLVRALQDKLTGNAVLSFYCSPIYQDSALYPVITQIERAAGFRRDDTPEERLAKFEGVVKPSAGDEAIALVAALLSVPAGERYPLPNLNPQRRKERTFAALMAQLPAVASSGPVLAVFEDVVDRSAPRPSGLGSQRSSPSTQPSVRRPPRKESRKTWFACCQPASIKPIRGILPSASPEGGCPRMARATSSRTVGRLIRSPRRRGRG
jgi:class 3 adenylate cyclase/DNA-binding response OmpR family regulator